MRGIWLGCRPVPTAPPLDSERNRIAAYLESTDGAVCANTQRAVKADLEVYAAWCGARGVAALPAVAGTVAAFVDAMAAARAPATVRRYVASIGAAHVSLGYAGTVRGGAVRLRRTDATTGAPVRGSGA